MIKLLADLRSAGIVRRRSIPGEQALDSLDALVIVADAAAAPAHSKLPDTPYMRTLWQQSQASPGQIVPGRLGAAGRARVFLLTAPQTAGTFDYLQQAGTVLRDVATARPARMGLVVLAREPAPWFEALLAAALAQSFALPQWRRQSEPAWRLERVELFGAPALPLRRIAATARAGNLVRWLTAMPPNLLDATGYRKLLGQLARRHGLRLRWYSQAALQRLGAGAFLAVARSNPRRDAGIARLSWGRRGARPDVALVGKGITFDTGGINLKPHRSMLDMHTDMSGSAVALASLIALSELDSPLAAEAWLAITENNTGPDAYRPQEVVQALNGTTIQVIHSDAEGRMALADTLSLAARTRPKLMLDFATLTGTCVYALGERYSGVFSTRPELAAKLVAAGAASGERVWSFPMDADYDQELRSSVADVLQCTVDSHADHILAARFLSRFVPKDIPWAHVDLSAATRKGGLGAVGTDVTGFGARLTLQLLLAGRP
ncbi:MAG TPA: leucyl aminopeptidase family protein [Steroidobacteraceae bacterium]|nr:leucyl aminopeptidase family protein [Steroidobacteraceae bacterium]